ncbi:MAG: 2-succinyl-5-enolpyruvyl-6-hydroxy-3-cyclohexene-1-carboxylic-acid synthase [bacterium]
MTDFKQSIINIAQICAQKQVVNFIISPGSRSAPLTLAFLRHPRLRCRTIVDERSAAFIALGLAQQTEHPVGLLCTSGTAGLNYSPAIAEAFYQQIPLLIFTADRPPEWIGQNDGQTIDQHELFGNHCRGYFELPVDDSHPDAKWQIERIISEAINTSMWPVPGPVHINTPLREPLYPHSDFQYQDGSKIISMTPAHTILKEKVWNELLSTWNQSNKKLIVVGMHRPDLPLEKLLSAMQQDDVAIVCDVTSNLRPTQKIQYSDMILGTSCKDTLSDLRPDLLISFGGAVVSKNLKLFLRKYKPGVHWQLQSHSQCVDTFQTLTRILPVSAEYFFEKLTAYLNSEKVNCRSKTAHDKKYATIWKELNTRAQYAMQAFLSEIPFCEFSAVATVLHHLPSPGLLQLGNSSIVRLVNFLGLLERLNIQVNSNRGTNGIDGTLSTAVGAALATTNMTTLIIGDLAFFYDRNALWHDYLPANLRIIVMNNYGGGIFRILDGASELPELTRHFEVAHSLSAKNTAADHGLNYLFCNSAESLEKNLPIFFEPQDKPAILEVQTDKTINTETFVKFKSIMRELK